ncbi:hypothetical protein BpHYR1_007423 [Brachionus plicatilis]|uniref:Uncharacterized protein n=1 Tax=Brachionus plicatilis TaxID=10195 RepID=A0A3M7SM64_BRAPC|nr:hypothetical protein BpHYR1_007423 [Brachionus plicatilis]
MIGIISISSSFGIVSSLSSTSVSFFFFNRRKCSVKKIRATLKLSFSKQFIPSKTYVQKLILRCSNKRKIVKFNKQRTIKKKGLEASYKTAHKIEEKFGKKYSSSVIRKYRFKLGFRLRHNKVVYDQPIYHLRLPSSRPEAIPSSSKFECKIHVWGGISYNGATEFAVIDIVIEKNGEWSNH